MAKISFKKAKNYYLPEDDAILKFKEESYTSDMKYFIFRYVKHPEYWEYETADGSEIVLNKKEWLKSLKQEEKLCLSVMSVKK